MQEYKAQFFMVWYNPNLVPNTNIAFSIILVNKSRSSPYIRWSTGTRLLNRLTAFEKYLLKFEERDNQMLGRVHNPAIIAYVEN